MFRSLHMKLVLILVLMIISVMAVVGTFPINSVNTFYLDSFYEQMQSVFTADTILSMEEAAAQSGTDGLITIIDAHRSRLGITTTAITIFWTVRGAFWTVPTPISR